MKTLSFSIEKILEVQAIHSWTPTLASERGATGCSIPSEPPPGPTWTQRSAQRISLTRTTTRPSAASPYSTMFNSAKLQHVCWKSHEPLYHHSTLNPKPCLRFGHVSIRRLRGIMSGVVVQRHNESILSCLATPSKNAWYHTYQLLLFVDLGLLLSSRKERARCWVLKYKRTNTQRILHANSIKPNVPAGVPKHSLYDRNDNEGPVHRVQV